MERPRGNLSDLYPRWLGARELLLRGRDPYSPEVTREIQRGYYGRELDDSRANDPRDQNGFAYPVYVVFLLWPLVHMDFVTVRILAIWALAGCAGLSVLLWELTAGLPSPRWRTLAAGLLLLGSYPFVEAISLQQPILLVALLLAGSFQARQRGWLLLAGVLMAFASIKPQVALLPVMVMGMWVSGDWRKRRRWVWGFAGTMAVLLGAAEVVLPGWLPRFFAAVRAYQSYMAGTSFLDWLVTPRWSGLAAALIVLAVLWAGWKCRGLAADAVASRRAMCLSLVAAVCTAPNLALYNQVLLLPGILFLLVARDGSGAEQRRGILARSLEKALILLLAWPWIAAGTLIVARAVFHSEAFVQATWQLPLYGTLALPVVVLTFLLVSPAGSVAQQRTFPLPERLA